MAVEPKIFVFRGIAPSVTNSYSTTGINLLIFGVQEITQVPSRENFLDFSQDFANRF